MQNNQSQPPDIRATFLSEGTSDLLVLKCMRQRVRLTLHQLEPCAPLQRPILYNFQERHGRIHRIALYNCQKLRQRPTLAFVGFISRKQKVLDASIADEIHTVDAQLVAEMVNNSGILGYSSLELRTGIWCNLVLMDDIEAKQQVLHTETHTHAAYQLAPRYYEWIRLHTGIMPHGLFHDEMKVVRTRHYIFQVTQQKPIIREHTYNTDRLVGTDASCPYRTIHTR
ncbi:MAG: hypothetical protein NVSMB49_27420 [Ktedonobacteraceae bacterium]